jgi:hypothetical protein
MLNRAQLVELRRALGTERVLSVYLDGSASDPATQRSWRVQLDQGVTELRKRLEQSPREERTQFEECVRLLDAALADGNPAARSHAWAAFITADGIRDAQPVSVPVPTLVRWGAGPCLAPYMRALKESRPVVVVVADAREATVYHYRLGNLDLVEAMRAHGVMEPPTHMGNPPRQGFHPGTRGTAGRDATQRTLLQGRDRMLDAVVERVNDAAGSDGWILLGGIKRVVARLAEQLTSVASHRVLELPSLDVHATEAEIAEAARTGASALRDAYDAGRVTEIAERAGAGGLGAVGPANTRQALEQECVRDLFLTHRYRDEHAADAEEAVRAALDQDASVEEVSGHAAELLDRHGSIAADLRFRPAAFAIRTSN